MGFFSHFAASATDNDSTNATSFLCKGARRGPPTGFGCGLLVLFSMKVLEYLKQVAFELEPEICVTIPYEDRSCSVKMGMGKGRPWGHDFGFIWRNSCNTLSHYEAGQSTR